jgi:hypothetical protein
MADADDQDHEDKREFDRSALYVILGLLAFLLWVVVTVCGDLGFVQPFLFMSGLLGGIALLVGGLLVLVAFIVSLSKGHKHTGHHDI